MTIDLPSFFALNAVAFFFGLLLGMLLMLWAGKP